MSAQVQRQLRAVPFNNKLYIYIYIYIYVYIYICLYLYPVLRLFLILLSKLNHSDAFVSVCEQ